MYCVDGQTTQPSSELVEHQSSSEVGGVNGALGSTAAGLGFRLPEKGGAVVFSGQVVRGCQNADDFAEHPAVAPELLLVLKGFPNRCTTGDGVDTAEDRFTDMILGTVAIEDGEDLDVCINPANVIGSRFD
ncbi:hypothetical protein OAF98_04225, partial [Planctomicrobium sp.]|nr:hypothetical protein [Planctomicrobium sp.]